MPVKSKSNRAAIEAELDRITKQKVEETADEMLREVQMMYRAPKSGRVYKVGTTATKSDRKAGRRFRSHRASAPGEAPAIDTAALRKGTTRTEARKAGPMRWVVALGVTLQSGRSNVAVWLEMGTRRIQPRPAWRPALAILRARRANLGR